MMKLPLPLLCLLLLSLIFSSASAHSSLVVNKNTAEVEFPTTVTFRLTAKTPGAVEKAYLFYGTNRQSCTQSAGRQSIPVRTSLAQSLEWTWDLYQSNSLPPGAQVWWRWELYTASGEKYETEVQALTVEDPDYDWKRLDQANISLYWSKGNDAFGKFLLNQAVSSMERLSKNAGVNPEGQVRITIYPDSESLLDAGLGLPGWAGGVTYPEYSSVMIAIPAGSTTWAAHVIPHEIAHLVSEQRTFNCLGTRMPTWLSEGISMFSEGTASRQDVAALEKALKDGELPALSSLANGFLGDSNQVNRAYTYSGQVVTFLIEEYGPEKMASLLQEVRSGKRAEPALRDVYGFDIQGLDLAWREAQGAPSGASQEEARTSAKSNPPVPTLALWTPVVEVPLATPTPEAQAIAVQVETSLPPASPTTLPPIPAADQAPATAKASLPGWQIAAFIGIGGLAVCLLVALGWRKLRRRKQSRTEAGLL